MVIDSFGLLAQFIFGAEGNLSRVLSHCHNAKRLYRRNNPFPGLDLVEDDKNKIHPNVDNNPFVIPLLQCPNRCLLLIKYNNRKLY